MGRSKRKKSARIVQDTIERIEIPTRDMVELSYDLTQKGNNFLQCKSNLIFDHDVTDKVVKIIVRYNHGDELLAEDFANFMSSEVKKHSKHVYPVEKIVVGSDKQRIPELTPDLDPMEAVSLWLEKKPLPAGLKKKKVKQIFQDVFSRISLSDYKKVRAKPFTFASFGMDNWKCFRGRQKIDLSDGIYSVVGRYKGEVGRSNRTGKSALVSTVPYVLYNHAKASQDRLVNDGQESGWTFQKIKTEEENIVIGREVLRKGSAKVLVDGKEKNVTDGKEFIHDLIGLDKNDFLNSCFVTEGQLAGLLGESSSLIEKHIRRWIGIDLWDEVEKELQNLKKVNVKSLQKYIDDRSKQLEVKEKGKPSREEIKAIQMLIDGSQSEMEVRIAHNNRIESQQDDRELLDEYEEAKDIEKQSKRVEKDLEKLSKEVKSEKENYDFLCEGYRVFERDINSLSNALTDFDGKCPIDSVECPRAGDFNSGNKELDKKIELLESDQRKLGKKRDKLYDILLPKIREEKKLKLDKEQLDRARDTIARLKDKVKNIKIGSIGEEIDTLSVRKQIAELNKELASKENQIDYYNSAKKKSVELSSLIAPLEEEIAYLNYAILISSRRGIPSIQMEGTLKEIEQIANEILSRMGADHRLLVSFEKEVKSRKEEICSECGTYFLDKQKECSCGHKRGKAIVNELSFKINDKGVIRDFEEDSSGGRALLALSFRIALAKYLGLVVLFLDECDYALDAYFLESFVGMINSLTEIGFKQVFVISHKQKVADSFDRNILVTRGSEFSTVTLEGK